MPNTSIRSIKMLSQSKITTVRIVVLVVAAVLFLAGLKDGGFRNVKNKAVMICYECMGIG